MGARRFNMLVIAALQYNTLVLQSIVVKPRAVEPGASSQFLLFIPLAYFGRLNIALILGLIPIITLLARAQLRTLLIGTLQLKFRL